MASQDNESKLDSVRDLGVGLGREGAGVVRLIPIITATASGLTVEAFRVMLTRADGGIISFVLEAGIASVAFFVAFRYGRKIWNGTAPEPDDD